MLDRKESGLISSIVDFVYIIVGVTIEFIYQTRTL